MADEAIRQYIVDVNASYDTIDELTAALETGLVGVTDDVTFLKDTIAKLESNPGPISPEDQALLTAANTRVNALATRLTPLKTAVQTLDDATTRPTPPTP